MKQLILIYLLGVFFNASAQETTSIQKASIYFKEAAQAAQGQQLWKEQLFGPTLFVEPKSRLAYSNKPDSAGLFKVSGDIFTGMLPKNIMIANTAIKWQGQDWAVVLWPLPTDSLARLSLILHESFHRVQSNLGLANNSPTADHLANVQGRIYFLLELQALRAAMNKPIHQRVRDLKNALAFRNKRKLLFPHTFENERVLEMNEGLAEFTGLMIARKKENMKKFLINQIDTAVNRSSLIRSFAYITGPIYGYLLSEKANNWTHEVNKNSSFEELIAQYYKIDRAYAVTDKNLTVLESQYNSNNLIQKEKQKETIRLETEKQYLALFTKKTILSIKLLKMNIQFNPNNLFDLAEHGTVYPTAEITDTWGNLKVSSVGMLMKDWQVVSVSMEDFKREGTQVIKGKGWEMTLNDGWELNKINDLQYQLTNRKSVIP